MCIRTMPIVEVYCSKCQIYLVFGIFAVGGFLVFGVLNAKNFAFSTLDASALKDRFAIVCFRFW